MQRWIFYFSDRMTFVPLINKTKMMEKETITIQSETFICIMNKLERIEELLNHLKPAVEDYQEYRKSMQDDRMDTDEAAAFLKVSRQTIMRYIKRGWIPYTQMGGKITFSRRKLSDTKNNLKRSNAHRDLISGLITPGFSKDKK